MRLKLQFWKTPTNLSIGILDTKGLPIINTDQIKTYDCSGIGWSVYERKLVLSTNPVDIGDICSISTSEHRMYIDNIVEAVTNEIFTPKKREVKVGDMVTTGGADYYTVVEILPEIYFNRYIITSHSEIGNQEIVHTANNVELVNNTLTFTKEITDNLETYTWEM